MSIPNISSSAAPSGQEDSRVVDPKAEVSDLSQRTEQAAHIGLHFTVQGEPVLEMKSKQWTVNFKKPIDIVNYIIELQALNRKYQEPRFSAGRPASRAGSPLSDGLGEGIPTTSFAASSSVLESFAPGSSTACSAAGSRENGSIIRECLSDGSVLREQRWPSSKNPPPEPPTWKPDTEVLEFADDDMMVRITTCSG